jgi:hypothetical protein
MLIFQVFIFAGKKFEKKFKETVSIDQPHIQFSVKQFKKMITKRLKIHY